MSTRAARKKRPRKASSHPSPVTPTKMAVPTSNAAWAAEHGAATGGSMPAPAVRTPVSKRSTPRRSPRIRAQLLHQQLGTPVALGDRPDADGSGSGSDVWMPSDGDDSLFTAEGAAFADSPSKLSSFLSPLKQTPRALGTPMASPNMTQFYSTLSPISAYKGMNGRAGELGKSPPMRNMTLANASTYHPSPMALTQIRNHMTEPGSPAIPMPPDCIPKLARRLAFPAENANTKRFGRLDFSARQQQRGLLKYEIKAGVLQNLTPPSGGLYTSPGQHARKQHSIARNLNLGGGIQRVGHRTTKAAYTPPHPTAPGVVTPPPLPSTHLSAPPMASADGAAEQLAPAAYATPQPPAEAASVRAPPAVRGASVKATPGAAPPKRRTPCNCKKSKCLKLYCECFAAGLVCSKECHCCGCNNTHDHDTIREAAITQTLERNPNAFKPKIQSGNAGVHARHTKGCHCKKSGCKKKYCECFQAGIACGENCKCLSCKNQPDDHARRMRDAAAKAAAKSNKRGNTARARAAAAAAAAPAPAPPAPLPAARMASPTSTQQATRFGEAAIGGVQTPGRELGSAGTMIQASPGDGARFGGLTSPARKRYRVTTPARPIQVSMTMDMSGLSPMNSPPLHFIPFGRSCPRMPRDVAVKIMSFLTSRDLYTVSLVCKYWNLTAFDDSLWDYIYM